MKQLKNKALVKDRDMKWLKNKAFMKNLLFIPALRELKFKNAYFFEVLLGSRMKSVNFKNGSKLVFWG